MAPARLLPGAPHPALPEASQAHITHAPTHTPRGSGAIRFTPSQGRCRWSFGGRNGEREEGEAGPAYAPEEAKYSCDAACRRRRSCASSSRTSLPPRAASCTTPVKGAMALTGMLEKAAALADEVRGGGKVFHVPIMFKEDATDNPNKKLGILAGCADGKLFTEATWNTEFCKEMAPKEGDVVVTARRASTPSRKIWCPRPPRRASRPSRSAACDLLLRGEHDAHRCEKGFNVTTHDAPPCAAESAPIAAAVSPRLHPQRDGLSAAEGAAAEGAAADGSALALDEWSLPSCSQVWRSRRSLRLAARLARRSESSSSDSARSERATRRRRACCPPPHRSGDQALLLRRRTTRPPPPLQHTHLPPPAATTTTAGAERPHCRRRRRRGATAGFARHARTAATSNGPRPTSLHASSAVGTVRSYAPLTRTVVAT